MKKMLLSFLLFFPAWVSAQNLYTVQEVTKTASAISDTSADQEPRYFYLAFNTNVFVNTIGGFNKRFSPSFEFGRTYGIFDFGLAVGKMNSYLTKPDTSVFLELRPTINIFSKGRFSEALCLGAGYVIKAKQGFVTEICNSINFNFNEIWSLSILQGFYYLDGTNNNRVNQYMGLNVTYNFIKKHSINERRKKHALIDQ